MLYANIVSTVARAHMQLHNEELCACSRESRVCGWQSELAINGCCSQVGGNQPGLCTPEFASTRCGLFVKLFAFATGVSAPHSHIHCGRAVFAQGGRLGTYTHIHTHMRGFAGFGACAVCVCMHGIIVCLRILGGSDQRLSVLKYLIGLKIGEAHECLLYNLSLTVFILVDKVNFF